MQSSVAECLGGLAGGGVITMFRSLIGISGLVLAFVLRQEPLRESMD